MDPLELPEGDRPVVCDVYSVNGQNDVVGQEVRVLYFGSLFLRESCLHLHYILSGLLPRGVRPLLVKLALQRPKRIRGDDQDSRSRDSLWQLCRWNFVDPDEFPHARILQSLVGDPQSHKPHRLAPVSLDIFQKMLYDRDRNHVPDVLRVFISLERHTHDLLSLKSRPPRVPWVDGCINLGTQQSEVRVNVARHVQTRDDTRSDAQVVSSRGVAHHSDCILEPREPPEFQALQVCPELVVLHRQHSQVALVTCCHDLGEVFLCTSVLPHQHA
mmetsp:Transcript_52837/g.103322  ORF Transcript_52837/g.103322 Transcript_52837/m.103322 type:complete len:272 (+) Transcript_52837:1308-2123(+)